MIVYYVSAHGYGHATRSSALAAALGEPVTIVTSAPARLFPGFAVEPPFPGLDLGLLQKDALVVDLEATRRAHEELERRWDEGVAHERARLRRLKAKLVISDVASMPFEAAECPAVAVANFDWDWMLLSLGLPGFRHADAYRKATLYLRLPMGAPTAAFRRVEEAPLMGRVSRLTREQAREAAGLGLDEKVALIAFGGFETGYKVDLPGYKLLRVGPQSLDLPFVDLVQACDLVVGKPGYGTMSEALLHERPMLYIPRPDFPETPFLVDWASRHGHVRPLDEGPWTEPLKWPPSRKDGAAVIASRIRQLLA